MILFILGYLFFAWICYFVLLYHYTWRGAFKKVLSQIKASIRWLKKMIIIILEKSQAYDIYQELTPFVEKLKEMRVAKYIRFSNNYPISNNIECFVFEFIMVNPEYKKNMDVLKRLIEAELRDFYGNRLGNYMPLLYVANIQEGEFRVWISKNLYGVKELRKRIEYDLQKDKPEVKERLFDEEKESDLIIGFDLEKYEKFNLKKKIILDIEKKPSGLVVGTSGSGKSFFITIFVNHLLRVYGEKVLLYYCDFKASEDTAYLSDYVHYYSGQKCSEGLQEYYIEYCGVRDGCNRDGRIRLLLFDEFSGFILWENQKSKKQAELYKGYLQEIILMGRSMKCPVWVLLQRPDSIWIQGRENFQTVITFLGGGVSKELATMVGLEDEMKDKIKEREFWNVGEAVVRIDGEKSLLMKVPDIKDIDKYKKEIVEMLACTTAEP